MSEQRLLKSVQRLATALTRLERQTAADHSVSVSQLRCLQQLAQQSNGQQNGAGLRVSDLAEEQGLAVSTMTRNVDLLERNGWIERQTDPADRRSVRVSLTDEGRKQSRRLLDSTKGRLSKAFDSFHPSDRVERAVALDRVAAALERL